MMPLDGLREVFLFALARGKFSPSEKKLMVTRWNNAVKDFTKNYEIKGKFTWREEQT